MAWAWFFEPAVGGILTKEPPLVRRGFVRGYLAIYRGIEQLYMGYIRDYIEASL